jgi:hypothetical protein
MNILRIIGGPIGPIISGVILRTFLIQVNTDGKEELFPSAVAFNLIFFICLILAIVLTTKVVSMRNRAIKVSSSSAASGINRQTTSFFSTKLPTVNRHFYFPAVYPFYQLVFLN